jgi:hypothetical protein
MTFDQAYQCLTQYGPATIHTLSGTTYTVTARTLSKGERAGERAIIAKPRSGAIYIHADCWRQEVTCQGTYAHLYDGPDGLLAWCATRGAR